MRIQNKYTIQSMRGFSLLELLIYVAILSILIVVIANAFISLSSGQGQSEVRGDVNAAVRFVGERMKQDIKNATGVTSPSLGAAAGTLSLTVGGVPVVYSATNGVLYRTENAGTPIAVTTTGVFANTPIFTRLENYNGLLQATSTTIKISLRMDANASSTSKSYSRNLETSVSLR